LRQLLELHEVVTSLAIQSPADAFGLTVFFAPATFMIDSDAI